MTGAQTSGTRSGMLLLPAPTPRGGRPTSVSSWTPGFSYLSRLERDAKGTVIEGEWREASESEKSALSVAGPAIMLLNGEGGGDWFLSWPGRVTNENEEVVQLRQREFVTAYDAVRAR